ncbi:MAG: hypothetical protein Q9213_007041 [Squamulea squamosa]
MAYAAAIYGLMDLAKTEAGESALIMNVTGVAELAAIKICGVMKANASVCVNSDEEADKTMMESYLANRQILCPSNQSIHSQMHTLTGGHGIDVVFSCAFFSSTVSRECSRHLALFDRFVDFDRKNVLKRSVLDTLPLHTGANYLSFDLLDLYSWKLETLANWFIMTSSTSGTLGTPSQANYSAANSFMDSLARHGVGNGLLAASLVLPIVLGIDLVAEHSEIEEALKRKGIYGIDEEHLLEWFEASMLLQLTKRSIDHVVVDFDPQLLQKSINDGETTDAFWLEDVRFKSLLHPMSASGGAASGGQNAVRTIKSAKSPAEAVQYVLNASS